MVDDNLARRAANANIRSYWIGVVGLVVLLYATFFQSPKTVTPAPAATISSAGGGDAANTRAITLRERFMEHTQGIGIAVIVLGMLVSGVMHLFASRTERIPPTDPPQGGTKPTSPPALIPPRDPAGSVFPPSVSQGPPPPSVRIIRHKEARKHNNETYLRIRDHFANAGWKVVDGNTDLPQHDNEIRVCGGSSFDRQMAQWGLDALGITWTNEYGGSPPKNLEVIVGRYTDSGSDTSQWDWLHKRAQSQLKGLESGLVVVQRQRETQLVLDVAEPYVEFNLDLYNGSVWPIGVETVSGNVTLDSRPIQGLPDVVPGNTLRVIQSTTSGHIQLRQWLSADTKRYIENRFLQVGQVEFSLAELQLNLRINPVGSEHGSTGEQTQPYLRQCAVKMPAPAKIAEVSFACWGFGDKFADKTEAVRGELRMGRLEFKAETGFLGDPHEGKGKDLFIAYVFAGGRREWAKFHERADAIFRSSVALAS